MEGEGESSTFERSGFQDIISSLSPSLVRPRVGGVRRDVRVVLMMQYTNGSPHVEQLGSRVVCFFVSAVESGG